VWTLPVGLLGLSACGRYVARKEMKSNKVFFHRHGEQDPIAMLALTPKQSLGPSKHNRVALAFDGDRLITASEEGINVCKIDDGGLL
jgi:hypothetical protein